MRYAIIENNKVVNIVLATAEFAQEQGWVECPENVSIGWDYNDGIATPPAKTDLVVQEQPTQPE
jgi:hypothetical protein